MTLRNLAARIARDRGGVAMVEFAFAAPLLLILILGGVELANFIHAHMRVNQIAVTVADNAGRINTAVDEANIYEVFAGAETIGETIEFEGSGRVILSSLQDNKKSGSDKGQMINWQRCWGDLDVNSSYGSEGKGRNDNSMANGMGKSGRKIQSSNDIAVMFVEVVYQYQPIVGLDWFGEPQIRAETAYNVRSRKNNNVSNSQSLTKLDCS